MLLFSLHDLKLPWRCLALCSLARPRQCMRRCVVQSEYSGGARWAEMWFTNTQYAVSEWLEAQPRLCYKFYVYLRSARASPIESMSGRRVKGVCGR